MRTKKGIITSAKMTGTVKVTVDTSVFHPVYKKRYKRTKAFLADVNGHKLAEGDTVVISECRPISKNKYFKVTEVLSQASQVSDMKEEKAVEEVMKKEEKEEKNDEKKEVVEKKDDTPAEEAPEETSTESDS